MITYVLPILSLGLFILKVLLLHLFNLSFDNDIMIITLLESRFTELFKP